MDNAQLLILDRFEGDVNARVQELRARDFPDRFWKKDATAWEGANQNDVASMLGWIDVVDTMLERVDEIEGFAQEVRDAGFERVILAGMGGSSLAPYVLSKVFPTTDASLPLHVLDSTHPATVQEIERAGSLEKTLVIVSSKSGSTAEPTAFDSYLFEKVGNPQNFVAITDPGSPFQQSAEGRGFRKVFLNFADIGGRFSALSYFGLVPAALLGIDVRQLLERAKHVVNANQGFGPAFELGAAMGELARLGVDKLTFLTVPELAPLGLWLEQLVAESTGKQETGILPVAGEEAGPPSVYGQDRFFAIVRMASADCSFIDIRAAALRDAGHPMVTVDLKDPYDIAAEFLRWEIATATAGAVLAINPFDQPNVQEAKDVTKRLLKSVEEQGSLPERDGGVSDHGLTAYGESCADDVLESLTIFFSGTRPGDYVAIHAYLHETPELDEALHTFQRDLRDALGLATTFGYGPRFLHSTGQYHKGGTNTGHFLQLTDQSSADAAIPGQAASWKQFVQAQAQGDMEALKAKGRRVISVDLGADASAGLATLRKAVEVALQRRSS